MLLKRCCSAEELCPSNQYEFCYQLTAIGGAMPSLHVSQGVDNQGQFIIQGGLPNHEVSWTIYAERNDVYMQNRPELRNPEVAKKPFNVGKYFHPQDYNLGEEYQLTQEMIGI